MAATRRTTFLCSGEQYECDLSSTGRKTKRCPRLEARESSGTARRWRSVGLQPLLSAGSCTTEQATDGNKTTAEMIVAMNADWKETVKQRRMSESMTRTKRQRRGQRDTAQGTTPWRCAAWNHDKMHPTGELEVHSTWRTRVGRQLGVVK